MRPVHIILSCEHGGNLIPMAYKPFFQDCEEELSTHRGWDIGSLKIAQKLSKELGVKLHFTKISRLLVDCNRSVTNREIFSHEAQELNPEQKEHVLNEYYYPYRNKIEDSIAAMTQEGIVLHLSVHTFVAFWHGAERMVDVGLLFDEERSQESRFCNQWRNELQEKLPEKLVMLNVPYQGADDGFTTYLRKKFPDDKYLGIELEINQKWVDTQELDHIISVLHSTLEISIDQLMVQKS